VVCVREQPRGAGDVRSHVGRLIRIGDTRLPSPSGAHAGWNRPIAHLFFFLRDEGAGQGGAEELGLTDRLTGKREEPDGVVSSGIHRGPPVSTLPHSQIERTVGKNQGLV
jgi:hypothetical protein